VDDVCIATDDEAYRQTIIDTLKSRFKLRDFEAAEVYLGLEMEWSRGNTSVKVHQKGFIMKLLDAFGLGQCKPSPEPSEDSVKLSKDDPASPEMENRPYRSLVGALLYTLGSRPDVASAVRSVSQYMSRPGDNHWHAAKRILRYLAGSADKGVQYKREEVFALTAYCDSDWASDRNDRKSITGYVIYAQGGPIVWKSKKQPTVSRSACEAEYVALAEVVSELLWVRMTLTELGIELSTPIALHIDNQAAKKLAQNPVNQDRTKHIDISYHFVRDVIKAGLVDIYYIPSRENVADLLTKATKPSIFRYLAGRLVC
jgi:hypothetical protein